MRAVIFHVLIRVVGDDLSSAHLARDVQKELEYLVGVELGAQHAELEDHTRNCGSAVPCIVDVMRRSEIDTLAMVVVNNKPGSVLVTAQVIEAKSGKAIADTEIRANDAELGKVAGQLVARLALTIGYVIGGRLIVKTSPPGASAFVDTATGRVAATEAGLILPIGEYRIVAQDADQAETATSARVAMGVDTQISVLLEESVTDSAWFWVAIAGGVVAVAAASVGIVAVVDRDQQLRFEGSYP